MTLSQLVQAYKDNVPPIGKLLVDIVVGGLVFTILFYVTKLIHYDYVDAVTDGWDSRQIFGLWLLEYLFFFADCAGVGVYVICRTITHIVTIVAREYPEWKKKP